MLKPNLEYVAYFYPGWHKDAWKLLNEWDLLSNRSEYFPGHKPLDQPSIGHYDDTDKSVISHQINTASSYGVNAFTFFLYYGPSGFVLDKPMRQALATPGLPERFQIGATWCMRLPHQYLPIPLEDDDPPLADSEPRSVARPLAYPRLDSIIKGPLLDEPVHSFVQLMTGRSTDDPTFIREMAVRHANLSGVLKVPRTLDFTSPSFASVLLFMRRLSQRRGDAKASINLRWLEDALLDCSMADCSIHSIRVLAGECAHEPRIETDQDALARLTVNMVIDAFDTSGAQLQPQDIRHIANLAARSREADDVLAVLSFEQLVDKLTRAGGKAASIQDIRAICEGIASDLVAAGN